MIILMCEIFGERVPLAVADGTQPLDACNYDLSYLQGELPPRHNVPAIPIYCHLGIDEVFTVAQHDDGLRGDWGWQKPRRIFKS